MRALTLDFSAKKLGIREIAEPKLELETQVLLRVHEVGVCATDRELAAFRLGRPPLHSDFLVPGHEGLAQVLQAGKAVASLNAGDWVVPIVRHGCLPPCAMCVQGRADLCITGRYTESGIFGRHGFWQARIVEDEANLVRVPLAQADVAILVEPLSVVEKVIERALEIHPGTITEALILGAGSVGLLAAQALQIRGVEAAVFSVEPPDHPRAHWVGHHGMTYLTGIPTDSRFDLIVEACGSATTALAAMPSMAPLGIMAILGARNTLGTIPFEQMLLKNQVVFGSVNAAPQHYRAAVEDLARMDKSALQSMISRRHFLDYAESFAVGSDTTIKVVHTLSDQPGRTVR